jgi:hypothetical protein
MRKRKSVVSQSKIEFPFQDDEVLDWYRLTPAERFIESQKLWQVFMLLGGNLDPEPDSQSPFYFSEKNTGRRRPGKGTGQEILGFSKERTGTIP